MTLIETGTPEKILSKDLSSTEVETSLWSEPTTHASAQQTAHRLLFYPNLIKMVENMADAHVSKTGQHRTGAEIASEHEQAMSGIMEVIYRGDINNLPADFAVGAAAYKYRQHHPTGSDYESYSWLVRANAENISRSWEQISAKEITPRQRVGLSIRSTARILINDVTGGQLARHNSALDTYRAIGYSDIQIARMLAVRRRSLSANVALTLINDHVSTATGLATAESFASLIPDNLKIPAAVTAAAMYYVQFAKIIEAIEKDLHNDPEITPSYTAYTAYPIINKLFTPEEKRSKLIAIGSAYMMNLYEAYKELVWDFLTFVSDNAATMRLVGDGVAVGLLYAQRIGVYPHLSGIWKYAEEKLRNITSS